MALHYCHCSACIASLLLEPSKLGLEATAQGLLQAEIDTTLSQGFTDARDPQITRFILTVHCTGAYVR
jgi:hypothetical protein